MRRLPMFTTAVRGLFAVGLLVLVEAAGTARAATPHDLTLPPLPTRALVICSDVSGSVPLSLAAATKGLVARSLEHAYATLDQGSANTLVEWDRIGVDTYSPQNVLLRRWIAGVHGEPTNPFLSLVVRRQIDAVIAAERRATTRAVHAVVSAIAHIPLHVEMGTDLLGCIRRFQDDTGFVTGPRTLIIASDLIGAAPESDWSLRHTTVDTFEYCSRTDDTPAQCGQRRTAWDAALRQAGASAQWYSSDNLDTLPYVTF